MKLALLSPQYFPTRGGVPVLVDLLGRALERAGHSVTVVTSEEAPDAGKGGFFAPVARPSPAELLRILRSADAVIVLQECISLTWPLSLGIVRRPALIFLQMHPSAASGLRGWAKLFLRRRLFASSVVCACSEYVAADVRKSEGITVNTVHNPYDHEVFHCTGEERRDIDLLYVGRLAIHKRCDVLLQAVGIREMAGENLSVVVAGDGPEEESLKKLARELALKDCRFVGPVSARQAADLMRSARTLVVPSGYEPFGIVVLEGLASGCRVITSNAGGLPEAGRGFAATFRFNDAADLARVLEIDGVQGPSRSARPGALADWLGSQSPDAVARRLLRELGSLC